jgi:hypothetical protein
MVLETATVEADLFDAAGKGPLSDKLADLESRFPISPVLDFSLYLFRKGAGRNQRLPLNIVYQLGVNVI